MNKKPFTPEEFRKIYSQVPRLTINLIIKKDTGIILTLRSLPSWHNMWHIPGGTLFYKESVEAAATRIAEDELGITVNIIKPLGYIEYPSEEKERGFGCTVGLAILCKAGDGALRVNEDADQVDLFATLPENTISEERIFLQEHWRTIQEA